MQEFIPKELHKCDSNIKNTGFNHVYALTEEEINNAIIKSKICNNLLISEGYDVHSDAYSLMYSFEINDHRSEANITRSALKEKLFTKALKHGEERYYNIPGKFSGDTLVISKNCRFPIKKLKEHHETLYCVDNSDNSDNSEKAIYFDSPKSFDKACDDICYEPTDSPENQNYNLEVSVAVPVVIISSITVMAIFFVRQFIKNKSKKRISEETPLLPFSSRKYGVALPSM